MFTRLVAMSVGALVLAVSAVGAESTKPAAAYRLARDAERQEGREDVTYQTRATTEEHAVRDVGYRRSVTQDVGEHRDSYWGTPYDYSSTGTTKGPAEYRMARDRERQR